MHANRSAQAGFTLLELLIAITIFSLILIALSGGVQFAGNAWRKQEAQITRQGDVNAVQSALRQLLASGRAFDGNAQQLKFTSLMPTALARGGLYDVELSQGGGGLVMSWKPHFKGAATGLPRDDTELLDGVESFALAYHTAQQGWQSMVTAKSGPIDLIAIKAHLSHNRSWPALVISPAINVSSDPKA